MGKKQKEWKRRSNAGDPPLCGCGCGRPVAWARGVGWRRFLHGHHIRINNPNNGDHCRGERSPMRRPEVVAKISGDHHWRNRPENAGRAKEVAAQQAKQMRGAGNPAWKGGRRVRGDGYVEVLRDGEYVMEHRVVVEEQILGRPLEPGEVVHHRKTAKSKADNRPEVLEVKQHGKHTAHHNRQRKAPPLHVVEEAPCCGCGCGRAVNQSKRGRRWNKYIQGHNPRIR